MCPIWQLRTCNIPFSDRHTPRTYILDSRNKNRDFCCSLEFDQAFEGMSCQAAVGPPSIDHPSHGVSFEGADLSRKGAFEVTLHRKTETSGWTVCGTHVYIQSRIHPLCSMCICSFGMNKVLLLCLQINVWRQTNEIKIFWAHAANFLDADTYQCALGFDAYED